MPNRIIREGILESERVNALTPNAELFYRRLMSVVDDFGRYSANPTLLRANCYPLKLDSVKEDSIKKHLTECADAGLIVLYTVEAKTYLEMQDFRQQMRAKESKYPSPDALMHIKCVADAMHTIANEHLGGDEDVVEKEDKSSSSTSSEPKVDACPHEAIVKLFGQHLPTLPQPRLELWKQGKNAKALAARWRWVLTAKKQSGERYAETMDEALAWFVRYFVFVSESDFLMGRKGDFVCTLGWLVNASNFEKVLSSNYVNRGGE